LLFVCFSSPKSNIIVSLAITTIIVSLAITTKDWEYPGYAPHSGTPADTENYTLLLKAVRTKLKALGSNRFGKPYGLSAGTVLSFNVVANYLTEVKCINFTALNIFTASLKHYHVVRIKSIKFKSTRSRHT